MDGPEIERLVSTVETDVERVRGLFDQYFMGIQKLEPLVAKKELERKFELLRREKIRNTAVRFRFQMAVQRYNTFQTYWLRICRQIEEGTFKRHLLRAEARFGPVPGLRPTKPPSVRPEPIHPSSMPPAPSLGLGRNPALSTPDLSALGDAEWDSILSPFGPESSRAAALPRVTGAPPRRAESPRTDPAPAPDFFDLPTQPRMPRPPPLPSPRPARASPEARHTSPPARVNPQTQAADPGIPDDRIRQIYSKYVETKRVLSESTAGVTFDGLAKTIRESHARLLDKHKGKRVDFEVTIRDGKTVLKPVVK